MLFLAGPNPVPDLMAFKRAGVPFTNIWAIESDKEAFAKAIAGLGREGFYLRDNWFHPAETGVNKRRSKAEIRRRKAAPKFALSFATFRG